MIPSTLLCKSKVGSHLAVPLLCLVLTEDIEIALNIKQFRYLALNFFGPYCALLGISG